MVDASVYWDGLQALGPRIYTCGYSSCGNLVAADRGWIHKTRAGQIDCFIYICPNCKRPTFVEGDTQLPGASLGNEVKHLPPEIHNIWSEIRTSTSHSAFTAAVLIGRKLLMHIAVGQNAKTGLNFVEYVNYLVDNHYAPPNSKVWVDKIRTHGNEATHEIVLKTKEDAEEILTFLEMLLKFIYEFPGRVPSPP
jgi:hypothetical protein